VIVLDASAAADYLLDAGTRGEWARAHVADADSVHAPDLLDYEVVAVIRRRSLARTVPPARAQRALADFVDLGVTRYPPLLERIWSLHRVLTTYDAAYVALAEALDAPLITTDERLARSHGHDARIETPAPERT
jgi:predicted nucleic acid-binding protein